MSTGSTQPFVPSATSTLAAGVASGQVPLGTGDTVLIYNSSSGIAFVAFGNGSAIATLTGTPVPPGAQMMLFVGPVVNTAAALLSAGSGNVYFTSGTGTAR